MPQMRAQNYTTAQILFTSARTATDSVRRRGGCHMVVALFFFTPLLDAALAEGLLALFVELGWGVLVLVLVVEGRSPVPPLPPAVRGTGLTGLVSSTVF
jgi:hypothetical protein